MEKAGIHRSRSVMLDPLKIKAFALQRKGIKTFIEFERSFLTFIDASGEAYNTTPKKAWEGKKLDKNRANTVAQFLRFPDYADLLPTTCPDIDFPVQHEWNAKYSPPGALLKAEYAIVPFHNRQRELIELDEWCASDEQLAIRLYSGAGGMGKTRLAIEQCKRLEQQGGWQIGFLKQKLQQSPSGHYFAWLDKLSSPLFIVVDYAETRRDHLVALLKAVLKHTIKSKIRIVLLARAAAEWWGLMKTERSGVGDLLMSPATSWVSLQALSLDQKTRELSYFMAADSFARCLNLEAPLELSVSLDADYFERVLVLHMQALLDVEGHVASNGIQGILEVVLNRERRFWESQIAEKSLPKAIKKVIASAMARITFKGGVKSSSEAMHVLNSIALLQGSTLMDKQAIIELLHELYPSIESQVITINGECVESINFIEPLQPDLLGEYLIQEELNEDPDDLIEFIFRS